MPLLDNNTRFRAPRSTNHSVNSRPKPPRPPVIIYVLLAANHVFRRARTFGCVCSETLMTTLPICLPCDINRKACSISFELKTLLCNG